MDAITLSNYIITHENSNDREVTNLRLQKLLYFVQARLLTLDNNSHFNDKIEAWEYGPVVPKSYSEFKSSGRFPIKTPEKNKEICDKNICKYIDSMLDYLHEFKTSQLVEITHNQTPWQDAIKKGIGTQITNKAIKEYFLNESK